jgi:hypothetical protein
MKQRRHKMKAGEGSEDVMERYTAYYPCVRWRAGVPMSCTRRDRSVEETWSALASLVIYREMKFAFKFVINFILRIFGGISYFKSDDFSIWVYVRRSYTPVTQIVNYF